MQGARRRSMGGLQWSLAPSGRTPFGQGRGELVFSGCDTTTACKELAAYPGRLCLPGAERKPPGRFHKFTAILEKRPGQEKQQVSESAEVVASRGVVLRNAENQPFVFGRPADWDRECRELGVLGIFQRAPTREKASDGRDPVLSSKSFCHYYY